MVDKQSADNGGRVRNDVSLRTEEDTSAGQATKSELKDPPSKSTTPPNHRKRKLVIGVLGALVLAALLIFGVPWIRTTLNTVSTDDAYVNSHVTFVAARVGGQVARVLVDDNNRVHKGDVLVQLDKEPFEDAVAVKTAAHIEQHANSGERTEDREAARRDRAIPEQIHPPSQCEKIERRMSRDLGVIPDIPPRRGLAQIQRVRLIETNYAGRK